MRTFLTGANGDIGMAIKLKLEKMGYFVCAPTRQELDLSKIKIIDNYFQENGVDFDVVIHCAGYNNPKNIEEVSLEDYSLMQDVNVTSFYRIMQNLSPSLKKKNLGYVLGISSLFGSISRDRRSAYAMSKHAMNGFIQTLAIEFGQFNILANSLSPGFVNTKMTKKNNSLEQIKVLESEIPLARLADPQDIAEVAYFLCSKNNRYISGQNIVVDGGFMAGGFFK